MLLPSLSEPGLPADFQVKHLILSFWFCRGPKYQNITKVSKSVFQLKISKYRLYRRRILRGFRHFSAFFAIYPNILEKMRQNVKKCKNPSHQISEIFRKSAKNGHVLILWLYSILWYFAGFLHFRFFGFLKKADVEQHSDRGGTIFRTNFRQKWTTFGTTFRICVFSNKETRFVPNHVRGLPKSLPRSAQIMSEILSQFLPGFA